MKLPRIYREWPIYTSVAIAAIYVFVIAPAASSFVSLIFFGVVVSLFLFCLVSPEQLQLQTFFIKDLLVHNALTNRQHRQLTEVFVKVPKTPKEKFQQALADFLDGLSFSVEEDDVIGELLRDREYGVFPDIVACTDAEVLVFKIAWVDSPDRVGSAEFVGFTVFRDLVKHHSKPGLKYIPVVVTNQSVDEEVLIIARTQKIPFIVASGGNTDFIKDLVAALKSCGYAVPAILESHLEQ